MSDRVFHRILVSSSAETLGSQPTRFRESSGIELGERFDQDHRDIALESRVEGALDLADFTCSVEGMDAVETQAGSGLGGHG